MVNLTLEQENVTAYIQMKMYVQKNLCLHGGMCITLNKDLFKCICPQYWLGGQCELPSDSCARNICGANAVCHGIKINGYDYDYVCVYDNNQKYGYDYPQAKSNPCSTTFNGFYPFGFSSFGYIECNMGRTYFRNGHLPNVNKYKETLGVSSVDSHDIRDSIHIGQTK